METAVTHSPPSEKKHCVSPTLAAAATCGEDSMVSATTLGMLPPMPKPKSPRSITSVIAELASALAVPKTNAIARQSRAVCSRPIASLSRPKKKGRQRAFQQT